MKIKIPLKRKRGIRLARTEIVHIRLEPRTRFAAELGSRLHKRSLSSFIEAAIENYLTTIEFPSFAHNKFASAKLNSVVDQLWHIDEITRFIRLAQTLPTLLTYEEECIWELIVHEHCFWYQSKKTKQREPLIDLIREAWEDLQEFTKTGEFDFQKLRNKVIEHSEFDSEETFKAFSELWNELWPDPENVDGKA